MNIFGIGEIFIIAGMVVLPCLGILIVAAIVAAVILLTRNNQNKPPETKG